MSKQQRRILMFDTGAGGLGVAVVPACRDAVDYAADYAGFPYGDWREEELCAHLLGRTERLLTLVQPGVVVVACNTANMLVLEVRRP